MQSNVLFVCLGNICRSPLAEGIMVQRLAEAGLDQVVVDSAGTGGWHAGEPPDPRSVEVAARHGIDLRSQRARQVQPADFERFHWVLAMDQSNLRQLEAMAPSNFAGRLELLLNETRGGAADVPDPYYGGPRGFDQVFALVDAAVRELVADLPRD